MKFYKPFLSFLLMTAFSFSGAASAAPLEVSCIGSPDAKNKIIYLHGADTQAPGAYEQWTRHHLAVMAKLLDLRIAVPRSNEACPPEALEGFPKGAKTACWENQNYDDLIAEVLTARETCFSSEDPYGVIGFSSGGDLLTRWMLFSNKYNAQPQWFIPVAIARPYYVSPKIIRDLNSNPKKITFVFGNEDPGIGRALIRTLKKTKTETYEIEFDGGHEFSPLWVTHAITQYLR